MHKIYLKFVRSVDILVAHIQSEINVYLGQMSIIVLIRLIFNILVSKNSYKYLEKTKFNESQEP